MTKELYELSSLVIKLLRLRTQRKHFDTEYSFFKKSTQNKCNKPSVLGILQSSLIT